MRRRGCLISFGALAALSLVCCVLLVFVAGPRIQDEVSEGIGDALSTEVANQIDTTGADLEPGTHTISMTDLEQQLEASGNVQNLDEIEFSAQNGEVIFSFGSGGQAFEFSGVPVAENGNLELTEVNSTGGLPDWLFPPDKLANAVESGINAYFDNQGLDIASVTAENDELVIEAVEAGA